MVTYHLYGSWPPNKLGLIGGNFKGYKTLAKARREQKDAIKRGYTRTYIEKTTSLVGKKPVVKRMVNPKKRKGKKTK